MWNSSSNICECELDAFNYSSSCVYCPNSTNHSLANTSICVCATGFNFQLNNGSNAICLCNTTNNTYFNSSCVLCSQVFNITNGNCSCTNYLMNWTANNTCSVSVNCTGNDYYDKINYCTYCYDGSTPAANLSTCICNVTGYLYNTSTESCKANCP
jgi:hypothetical protein